MARRLHIHLDAAIVLVLVLIASFSFNLYQRYQYSRLLQAYIDLEWDAQNTMINLGYVTGKLEQCHQRCESNDG